MLVIVGRIRKGTTHAQAMHRPYIGHAQSTDTHTPVRHRRAKCEEKCDNLVRMVDKQEGPAVRS